MKTKLPSAIIYGWDRLGTHILKSDIYYQEWLFDDVIIHSYPDSKNLFEDFSKHKPDVVMFIGEKPISDINYLKSKFVFYDQTYPDNIIANDIVAQSCRVVSENIKPFFSVFTPTFRTGEKIYRAYNSLKNQLFKDWEWVIVDDSDNEETWNILQEISEKDFRVKPHRIFPITKGIVGLSKNRAASLCEGEWLVELDHDDELLNDCLLEIYNASQKFPDAGFTYSNCCEIYENGNMKYYYHDWSGNYYGKEDNNFDFGYAGHSWIHHTGKDYLVHHYPDINPLTIRFNISMPNHVRAWKKKVYDSIGGHCKNLPVADDFELIIRTFLNTRMIHIKKLLYVQWSNENTTTDNNVIDINRRARLIRDFYDLRIHNRILELGFEDWNWIESEGHSHSIQTNVPVRRHYEEEQVMNYIFGLI